MNWNIKLGRWLGIDVYLHFTFLLLLAFIGVSHWLPDRSLGAGLAGTLFFCSIFLCVLLHEFGHSLAARRFGIETKEIVLLPIGGVARLERMPERPTHEFWIALAGPAVNVVIMIMLSGWLLLTNTFEPISSLTANRGNFAERLLIVNGFLVAFNLLPAFPMDGGRVLRSLLALKTDYAKATLIAGRTGQAFAIGFGLFGLISNPFLILIAVFVWMGASQEMAAAKTRGALQGLRVSDVMSINVRMLSPDDGLSAVSDRLLEDRQTEFPVVLEGRLVGILERQHLLEGLEKFGPQGRVGDAMVRDFPICESEDELMAALQRAERLGLSAVPVICGQQLIGLVTLDGLQNFLLLHTSKKSVATRKVVRPPRRVPPPLPANVVEN